MFAFWGPKNGEYIDRRAWVQATGKINGHNTVQELMTGQSEIN